MLGWKTGNLLRRLLLPRHTLRRLCHAGVAVLLWHAAVTVSSSTRRAAAGGEAGVRGNSPIWVALAA